MKSPWIFRNLTLVALMGIAQAIETASPDGKWRAELRPDTQATNHSPSESSIHLVANAKSEKPGEDETIVAHPQKLVSMNWSPDSKFLVITFDQDPNSEDPAGFQTMVFRMEDRTLRDLNGYFPDGFVTGPPSGFEGKSGVILPIQLYNEAREEILPMQVDLEKAAPFLPFNDNDGPAGQISQNSPDGALLAIATRTQDVDFPDKRDLDGFRLSIGVSQESRQNLRTSKLGSARSVDQMRWSPDSRFLVITTSSSGGHGPLNELTFVYCREDDSFRQLSYYRPNSSITSPHIGFAGPSTAILGVYAEGERYYTIAVRLDQDYLTMPQEGSEEDADGTPPILTLSSLDRKWFAAARSIPDENSPWRMDLDHLRLIIRAASPDTQAKETLRYDGSRQRPAALRWSPEGRYLVVLTRNPIASPAASPEVLLWSADDGTLRRIPADVLGGFPMNSFIGFPQKDLVEFYVTTANGDSRKQSVDLRIAPEQFPVLAGAE